MEEFEYNPVAFEKEAELLKTLAHPVRLCMVRGLIHKGKCNVTTMHHCLEMPQSTISQHLGKLKQAKIVTAKRVGLEMYYTVDNPKVIELINIFFDS